MTTLPASTAAPSISTKDMWLVSPFYDLAFIMSDGEWKLIKVNVDVKKP